MSSTMLWHVCAPSAVHEQSAGVLSARSNGPWPPEPEAEGRERGWWGFPSQIRSLVYQAQCECVCVGGGHTYTLTHICICIQMQRKLKLKTCTFTVRLFSALPIKSDWDYSVISAKSTLVFGVQWLIWAREARTSRYVFTTVVSFAWV